MNIEGLSLEGRVAIVTGGSRGIGRAVVVRLAQLGASVVINYVSDEGAAKEAAGKAQQFGAKTLLVQANVSKVDEALHLVKAVVEEFGRLDILVCNAGIWEGAPVEEISEELWDRVLDINLKGTWAVCRAAVPQMKRQSSGRIVIISSTAGQRGETNFSNYAASKGGQISFTKSLATELAPFGINVNAIAPGWVDTEMNTGAFADQEYQQNIEASIPLGRLASVDDVAHPTVFLCTEWARHITGEVLNVNGGSVLCG